MDPVGSLDHPRGTIPAPPTPGTAAVTARLQAAATSRAAVDEPGAVLVLSGPEGHLPERADRADGVGRVARVDAADLADELRARGWRTVLVTPHRAGHHAPRHDPVDGPTPPRLVGHPTALPVADASLDAAGGSVAVPPAHRRRSVEELHRVVRPGGTIALLVAGRHDPDGWRELGFDVEHLDGDLAVATATSTGPPDVRIRAMRDREADDVGAITLASYDRYGSIQGPYREFLADPLRRRDGCTALLVAEVEGRVAGTVSFVLPDDREWEGRPDPEGDAAFRVLAVADDVEGRGIGRRLVTACLQRAAELDRSRVVIISMAWMTRAHRLYERLGFARRPDLDVRFPGGDGHVFTYDLHPDAARRFPAPGPVPTQLPWFEDAWDR